MGNILIIDPSLVDRKRMRSIIEAAGHSVIEMSAPTEAMTELLALSSGGVDLILTELHVEGITTLEFIRWVKAQQSLQSIPILVVTPQPPREVVIELVMAGTATIVTKPFGGDLLLRRVTESLGEQAKSRQGVNSNLSWHIDDYLRRELKRANRSGAPFSVVVCRVLPDTLGHMVPRLMGGLVQIMRESDVLVRLGESQVITLLPDTDARGAAVVEAKVRRMADSLNEEAAGDASRLEVATGAATFPTEASDPGSLMSLARERCDKQVSEA